MHVAFQRWVLPAATCLDVNNTTYICADAFECAQQHRCGMHSSAWVALGRCESQAVVATLHLCVLSIRFGCSILWKHVNVWYAPRCLDLAGLGSLEKAPGQQWFRAAVKVGKYLRTLDREFKADAWAEAGASVAPKPQNRDALELINGCWPACWLKNRAFDKPPLLTSGTGAPGLDAGRRPGALCTAGSVRARQRAVHRALA